MKIVLIFAVIFQTSYSKNVYPDYLKQYVCKVSDPDYNRCLLTFLKNVLPYFVKGIPEMGVPPLDPYYIKEYSSDANILGVGQFQAQFTDIEVTGFRNMIFNSLKVDFKSKKSNVYFSIPWLNIDLNYRIHGDVIIPVDVDGLFRANITDILVKSTVTFDTYKIDDIEYYKLDKITPKLSIGGGRINLETTKEEFASTVKTIESFFNRDPRGTFEMILPFIIEQGIELVKEIGNHHFTRFPASEFAPQ